MKLRNSLMNRALASVTIAVAAGGYASWYMRAQQGQPVANDFTWHWIAARAVLHGENPYIAVVNASTLHLNAGYLYPLPDALIVAPLAWLSPLAGACVFVAISAGLLTWGLTRQSWARLAMLGGIPFFWATGAGQMSVLMTAGVLLPGLGWLALMKPNLAVGLVAFRPRRSMIVGGIALVIVSFVVQPTWLHDWISVLRQRDAGNYRVPLLMPGGPLLLLALIRWRLPEARLLVAMACVPQSMLFYDQLPLGLVALTRNESMVLAITTFFGYLVATLMLDPGASTAVVSNTYGPAIIACIYLPCLLMVLRRDRNRYRIT